MDQLGVIIQTHDLPDSIPSIELSNFDHPQLGEFVNDILDFS
jgi:hypothetical protein